MDFDLRGLDAEARASFWLGVDRAYEKFADWEQGASFSPTVGVIRLFYERRNVRTQTLSIQVAPINLDDLWFPEKSIGVR